MGRTVSISGYTICYESQTRGQELERSLESFLAVCDTVVVVDCNPAGDPNGTRLREFAAAHERVTVLEHPVDAASPDAAIEFFCTAPTLARRACDGDAILAFELDDFADIDRRDELHSLAGRLELESAAIDGFVLPRADYCGVGARIDGESCMALSLTRNDPFFVHDVPRNMRRFDDTGRLRCTQDFGPARSHVRSDTLQELRFRSCFAPDMQTWLEDAHGRGDRALLARDRIQVELAAALERGPAIFSTRAAHAEDAMTWERERAARWIRELRIDGAEPMHHSAQKAWTELSDAEISQLASAVRSYGQSTVLCGRTPSPAVLELLHSSGVAQA